jgi:hypothetical protein
LWKAAVTTLLCPSCKHLSWEYPKELTPYFQEGFACELRTGTELNGETLETLVGEVDTRVSAAGFRFDCDLDDLNDMTDSDRAALNGTVTGTIQLEMKKRTFEPDEESRYYLAEDVLRDPTNLELIAEKALDEMFNNRGGDGYYAERLVIVDCLTGLTCAGIRLN